MYALVRLILLVAAGDGAQDTNDAKALLQKAESLARSVKSWRAEIVETSKLSGNGMDLQSQVHVKIAVQAPLKMGARTVETIRLYWLVMELRAFTWVTVTTTTGIRRKQTRIAISRCVRPTN